MNLVDTTQAYVNRLIPHDGRPKILLLDSATVPILSLAATQSQILKHDVFLTERLSNISRKKMRHLDCIVFVRPSSESVDALIDELRSPKYGNYTIAFTNLVRKSQLERVAQADDNEAVSKVLEVFMDWKKINKDLFSLGLPPPYLATNPNKWELEGLEQCVDSLFAVVGSLKLGVPAIRYDGNSKLSQELATQLERYLAEQTGLLPKQSQEDAVVMILDRFNDPVTPLISHWTYQAMVDELLGITNNCVDLSDSPDVPQADKQLTLSQDQDQFFDESMYMNLGDLGSCVRDRVQRFSSQYKSHQTFDTVADMKKAVYELPELEKLKSGIAKHVSLVGELQRIITQKQLLAFSELEQNLACNENHQQDLEAIRQLLNRPEVDVYLKYRIVALYSLRYRKHPHSATAELLQTLSFENRVDLDRGVRNLLNVYSSNKFPMEDLFNQDSFLMRAQQGLKGLRGVENVYTQHRALLETLLAQLIRGKLPKERYPFVKKQVTEPKNVLVFIVGGVTMEEARIVGEYNKLGEGPKVILGGTTTVNPTEFLDTLGEFNWK